MCISRCSKRCFIDLSQFSTTAVSVSSNIAISATIRRSQSYCNYNREGHFVTFLFCQSVSSCNIWNGIFKKPESTWRDVSLSTKEFSCLDGSLACFLLLPLSDHSECRVCVRTAAAIARRKPVPNNSLSDPDCYGILWLYWDRYVWQVLYAARWLRVCHIKTRGGREREKWRR